MFLQSYSCLKKRKKSHITSIRPKAKNQVLHQKESRNGDVRRFSRDIGLMAPPGGVLGLCLNMVYHDSCTEILRENIVYD